MEKQRVLDRLLRLREDRNEWNTVGSRQRLNVKLGKVVITICNEPNGNTLWQVDEPAAERTIQPWSHASGVADAMRQSCDFTRAYLLGRYEPQHTQ